MKSRDIKNQEKSLGTFLIGAVCSVSYLGVYVVRNLLSTVSPQIIEAGQVSNEKIGLISSAFFLTYAVGQLLHGVIGDRVKGKYMVGIGMTVAAVCNWLMLKVIGIGNVAVWVYGALGFFLAMVYAPMVKTISENTDQIHAQKCNLALSVASLLGAPVAGLIVAMVSWKMAFAMASVLVLGLGAAYYLVISALERKQIVQYQKRVSTASHVSQGVVCLFKRKIVLYTLISALTGIVRTAVVFWLPRYLTEYLIFFSQNAALLFSGITMGISLSAFAAIAVYHKLHRNMEITILLSFLISAVSFGMLAVIRQPIANMALMTLALMASNCASSIVWTVYCPSLCDTGLVSTATGYLDFISYAAAAISNVVFANAVNIIGWENLVVVWSSMMATGVLAMVADYWMHRKTPNISKIENITR